MPDAAQLSEYRLHLEVAHHDRQPRGALCMHDVAQWLERTMQDLRVEEEQSRQGLILCRSADAAVLGQVGQECGYLRSAHRVRPPVMEQRKPSHPADIGLHRLGTIVTQDERVSDPLEQRTARHGRWWSWRHDGSPGIYRARRTQLSRRPESCGRRSISPNEEQHASGRRLAIASMQIPADPGKHRNGPSRCAMAAGLTHLRARVQILPSAAFRSAALSRYPCQSAEQPKTRMDDVCQLRGVQGFSAWWLSGRRRGVLPN